MFTWKALRKPRNAEPLYEAFSKVEPSDTISRSDQFCLFVAGWMAMQKESNVVRLNSFWFSVDQGKDSRGEVVEEPGAPEGATDAGPAAGGSTP